MNDKIELLGVKRRELQTRKSEWNFKLKSFMDSPTNSNLLGEIETLTEMVGTTEEVIRNEALTTYSLHPEQKQLGDGVTIRVKKVVSYDEVKAFNWALEHKLCLSLNDKVFKKCVLGMIDIPGFVKVEDVPSVGLPTKIPLICSVCYNSYDKESCEFCKDNDNVERSEPLDEECLEPGETQ